LTSDDSRSENKHDADASARINPAYWVDQKKNVPSRVIEVGAARGSTAGRFQHEDIAPDDEPEGIPAVPVMLEWACDPDDVPFAVLLGEYGMGKTWSSRLLAQELEKRRKNPPQDREIIPTPYYFDLRKIVTEEKSILSGDLPELEFLLGRLSVRNTPSDKKPFSGHNILDAVQKEGALIIFDGLDEVLAHKRNDNWGKQFIDLLFSALPFSCWPKCFNPASESLNPGKVLLTCRTHYFKNVSTQNSQILGIKGKAQKAVGPRAWQLLPFSKAQILKYLELHLPGQDPEAVFDLLASVHNLTEISSRPVGLEMVSRQINRIEAAKREGKTMNGASIYAFMVEEWLERDTGKHRLLEEDKRILMQGLALFMWQNGLRELPWERLAKWFLEWLYLDPVRQAMYKAVTPESLLTDLRNATFLVRPDSDVFTFAHTSILEYFLALCLHRSLEKDEVAVWRGLNPSPEALAFLLQHQQTSASDIRERVRQRLAAYLARADGDTTARASWLELYLLLPEEWRIETLDISGLNLEGRAFSGLQLETLRADGARLAESWWKDCRFTRSSWKNAEARQIIFERIQGEEADFGTANLNFARWRQVSLEPCFESASRDGFQISECAVLPVDTSIFSTLRPWRLQWDAHVGNITACAISADGETIVTASDDGTARIWNREGECLRILKVKGHTREVIACAISAGGEMIVTASVDQTARIWNKEGECLHTLKWHIRALCACAISADGEMIVTASTDGPARIWNKEGECLRILEWHVRVLCACAISVGGEMIVTASDDRTARIWNKEGECLHILEGHTRAVRACAISAGGEMIVTASDDKTARIWNKEGECLRILKEHTGEVGACAISAGGEMIVTASMDKTARIWDKEGKCLHVLKWHTSLAHTCAVSAGGEMIVTAADDGTARIWNKEGECLHVLKEHTDRVLTCAISAGGEMIVTASDDGTARIWNKEGECLRVLKGHTDRVLACAISAGGEMIVTASSDKTARIWNGKGECLCVLKWHTGGANACAISAGGEIIVTASRYETARIWNRKGECLGVLEGHTDWIRACAISADGEMIVTASDDRTARIWNGEGKCLRVLKGHTGLVHACAISADGEMIATASHDKTVRLWNKKGDCLRVLKGHTGCAISADGNTLVTTAPNRIFLWTPQGECKLEIHPATQTRVWLDAETQTLQVDGPEWPELQLHDTTGAHRNLLGLNIAAFGPRAHEQLANAEEWRFVPRSDIQPRWKNTRR
jgi:WD40 repeat protein